MDRKQEVKLAREELKAKGVKQWLIDQLKYEWMPSEKHPYRPLQAIGVFFKWVFIFYSVFVLIQAVNFSFIFCESEQIGNFDYIKGRIEWNNYLTERNDYCAVFTTSEFLIGEQIKPDKSFDCKVPPRLTCDYDFEIVGNTTVKNYLEIVKENIKYKVPLWN